MSKRSLAAVVLTPLCFALGGSVVAQTSFPVRLDPPQEPAALTSVQRQGSFSIETSTHYQKRLALEVDPTVSESILRVDVPQVDTSLTFHVTAFASRSMDGIGALKMRETYFFLNHKTSGSWNNVTQDGAMTPDGGSITLIADLNVSFDNVTLKVTNPESFDRLTLFIEFFASRPVTLTELY